MLATRALMKKSQYLRAHRLRASFSASAANTKCSPTSSEVLPVFPGLPQTISLNNLPKPEMKQTIISNGLRIASQETYGQLCNFGVFIDAGSRVETQQSRGATHLMELMSFKSSTRTSSEAMHLKVAEMGGSTLAFSTRDLIMLNVEVLRESLEPAMELLAETLIRPAFLEDEIEEMKMVMGMICEQGTADQLLREGIHQAAFGDKTPMGQSHHCPPALITSLNSNVLTDYRNQHMAANRMALIGAGVDHEEFAALGEKYFSGLAPKSESSLSKQQKGGREFYTGGEFKNSECKLMMKSEFSHVALSWMSSWERPKDRVVICVIQVLLGGGNSFSAGGPGKGMYSRLYRDVLNRYHDVETAEGHVEASGLLGIIGACAPQFTENLVYIMADQFARLAYAPISDEELSRARNMLKCNVLTCLESHHMVFEDIGQQIIYDDKYLTPLVVCDMIDNVSAEDIARVARDALELGPSIASCGEHTSLVPSIEKVRGWFASK